MVPGTEGGYTKLYPEEKIMPIYDAVVEYKKRIYIYGIAQDKDEMKQVIEEAKSILDVDKVVASILLVEDLRIQKN